MFGREPVLWTTAARACILAGMGFGLDITASQVASLMLAVEAVIALIARSQVSPTKKVWRTE